MPGRDRGGALHDCTANEADGAFGRCPRQSREDDDQQSGRTMPARQGKPARLLSASGVMEACGGGFRYDDGSRRSAVAGEHGGPVIMATVDPVNLASLLDDAKCFALVRQHRWPEGSVALDAAATRWSGTGMTTRSRIGSGIAARRARRALTTSAGQCWPGTISRCGSGCCAST